jgi:small redox-active disulfide protein 2
MKIEVAGPGCPRCRQTERNVKAALEELGLEADVVKVTDVTAMARKGVMMTPAVLVDGVVKCQGKIPAVSEVETWFAD